MVSAVHLLDNPDMSGDGDPVPDGRRLDDGPDLLGFAPDTVLFIFLENRVELEVVRYALAGKTDDQASFLRQLYVILRDQVIDEDTEVIPGDILKGSQRKDSGRKLRRRHLSARCQGAHGLVVEQAERKPASARGFDPSLFQIELDQRDPLQECPRDLVREQIPCFRVFFPHDKPHLTGLAPSSGAAHPLEKCRDRERSIDLESTLQLADVDAKLQGGSGAGSQCRIVIAHLILRSFPESGGQVAVMDQKTVRLMIVFTVRAKRRGDLFTFFSGIAKDQTFPAAGMLKDIAHARIRCERRLVRGIRVRLRLAKHRHISLRDAGR